MRVANEYCWKWEVIEKRAIYISDVEMEILANCVRQGKNIKDVIFDYCLDTQEHCPTKEVMNQMIETLTKDFLTVK